MRIKIILLCLLAHATWAQKTIGIINISVGNVRTEARESAEMSTQVMLGTPVRLLEKAQTKNWYRIEMPDHYQGWIEGSTIIRMDSAEYKAYRKSGTELIVQAPASKVYLFPSNKSEVISELIQHNRLMATQKKIGFWEIRMADGTTGYVSMKDVENFDAWKRANPGPTENRMMQSAHQLLGIPYLWGGTSIKGMDCSGFTKLVFQSNGWIIPRDASQQAREGELVDSLRKWENLKPGDLVFFGEKRPDGTNKVVHVGIWEGRNAYLHAADRTRRASMDPQSKDFDAYNLNRYLFTKRINSLAKEVQKID
jgi:cell wall-associated NlpC family hydrolase